MNRMMMIAAAAALACGCAGSGSRNVSADPFSAAAEKTPLVSVVKASPETVQTNYVYSTTVMANAVNNIASQAGGRIRKLNVEVGDFVEAGQVLAEMDRVNLDQAALRLKNEETELARLRQLYEEGGLSQSDFEARELSYSVQKSSYDNLLENTVLRAPVSGVVTARNYDKGDMYGMSSPIYTVQQITPVKMLVAVSEVDYTKVSKGDKVTLVADALPGKTFEGRVVRIYPVMDAASHTFSVEVQVPNSDRALRPGMYARATVNLGEAENITLPDAAVLKQQGSGVRTVFVLDSENVAQMRVVTVGQHFDGKYEILSGLEPGETVVVKGQNTLKAGQKVEVQK